MKKKELEKLTTKRLLSYKRKHFPSSDFYARNIPLFELESALIDGCNCETCIEIRKNRKVYLREYSTIKEILNKRKHIK